MRRCAVGAVTEDRDEIVQVQAQAHVRIRGTVVRYSTEYGYRTLKEYISVSLSDFATSAATGPTGPVQGHPTKGFPGVAD
jgi:hypothetical protein